MMHSRAACLLAGVWAASAQNVMEVVQARGDMKLLASFLQTSGLSATLAGTGPYTLFAPTDTAWDTLGSGTVALLKANGGNLDALLRYHLLSGVAYNSVQAAANSPITTAQGSQVTVALSGAGAVVNGAAVVSSQDANLAASNGLVHPISRVLVYTGADIPTFDAWGYVQGNGQLTTLEGLVVKHGLSASLTAAGPITFFAPTNTAFGRLSSTQFASLSSDAAAFTSVLKYSVVAQYRTRADLVASAPGTLTTTESRPLAYRMSSADVVLGAADVLLGQEGLAVTTTDLHAANGLVHLVDRVLLPDGVLQPQSVYDVVAATPELSTLAVYMRRAGMDATLRGTGPFTLLAPTNAAFAALSLGATAVLDRQPQALQSVLAYHVISGASLSAAALASAGSVLTSQGTAVAAAASGSTLTLNSNVVVSTQDQEASNGVIHIIGGVLQHAGSPLPTSDIVGVIAKLPATLSTLYSVLVGSAALGDYAGAGPLTLFAPSDTAFAAIPQQQLQALIADGARLARVLRYHLVPRYQSVAELRAAAPASLPTHDTPNLVATAVFANGSLGVGGAAGLETVLAEAQSDQPASNGVLHVVHRLLLPADLSITQQTLWERAQGRADLTTFVELSGIAQLSDVLSQPQQQTLFAPSNAAFAALPAGVIESLRRRPSALQQVLLYHHVTGAALTVARAATSSPLTTTQGSQLRVQGSLVGGVSAPVASDLDASNGLLTVIDTVLLYAGAPVPTLDFMGVLEAEGTRYSQLRNAIATAGMATELRAAGNRTLLAPTDAAFAAVPAAQLSALLADAAALAVVIRSHLFADYRSEGDMRATSPAQLTSVAATAVTYRTSTTTGRVDVSSGTRSGQVLYPDLYAVNGVVHGVDAVLATSLPSATPAPLPFGLLSAVVQAHTATAAFAELLRTAGETNQLSATGPLTVFAFSDQAWAALPTGVSAALSRDQALALQLVRHSYAQGRLPAASLPSVSPIRTVGGADVIARQSGAGVVIANAAGAGAAGIVSADVPASNGLLHVLDAAVLPVGFAVPSDNLRTASASLTELTARMAAVGVVNTLADTGPYTLFAPSDTAMAALPASAEPGALATALRRHIVRGYFTAAELAASAPGALPTVDGGSLPYQRDGGGAVTVGAGARVVLADQRASNGIMHVLDAVAVFPGAPAAAQTAYAVLAARQDTADFAAQLRAAGLVTCGLSACTLNVQQTGQRATVFAPTNAAWAALPLGVKRLLELTPSLLASVLRYHIITANAVSSAQLPLGSPYGTAEPGGSVTVQCCTVVNAAARLMVPDLAASDAIVHVVDAVLLPPDLDATTKSVWEALSDAPATFATFAHLADAAGIASVLATTEPLTLMAPDNAAFSKLPAAALRALAADPATLRKVVLYHAVPLYVSSADLSQSADPLPTLHVPYTLAGGTAGRSAAALQSARVTGGQGSAVVTNADAPASNGVIHTIDSVLLPPDVTLPAGPAPTPPPTVGGGQTGVVAWGDAGSGGDSSTVNAVLGQNTVAAVYGNDRAFAAVLSAGAVVSWGDAGSGGDATGLSTSSPVVSVAGTRFAFASLRADGSVVAWGDAAYGGSPPSPPGCCVAEITATTRAFAARLDTGGVAVWGSALYGGDSSTVAAALTQVSSVSSTDGAFAAIAQGRVVAWGIAEQGGDTTTVAASVAGPVTAVYSTYSAFAAVRPDGIVAWGGQGSGGDASTVAALLSAAGWASVQSTSAAFAALHSNGSVVAWGSGAAGGDATTVAADLAAGVRAVRSTRAAFAAVLNGGGVVTWGGHGGDSTTVASLLSGVSDIYATDTAFAAVTAGGRVVTWGSPGFGGTSTTVQPQLLSGVSAAAGTQSAFAASKLDGSVVTWGEAAAGGDSATVASFLTAAQGGARSVSTTHRAFAAFLPPAPTPAPTGCDITVDCNGNAATVTPAGGGQCTCTCLDGYIGARCEACVAGRFLPLCVAPPAVTAAPAGGTPAPGAAPTIAPVPPTPVPTRAPTLCLTWTACFGNARAVTDAVGGGCVCECKVNYAGTRCDRCAPGYVDYPACGAGLWVLVSNDRSCAVNAEGASADAGAVTDLLPSLAACQQACGERSGCTAVDWHRRSRRCAMYRTGCAAPLDLSDAGSHWRLLPADQTPPSPAVTPAPGDEDTGCPWVSSTGRDNEYDCADGSVCDLTVAGTGCCGAAGGRLRCPHNHPQMCATKQRVCDSDYCCVSTPDDCEPFGGPRPCAGYVAGVCGLVSEGGDGRVWDAGSVVTPAQDLTGLRAVFSNTAAFAAIRTNGSVVTWGAVHAGGSPGAAADSLSAGVSSITAADRSFAALKVDGSVSTWGDLALGTDAAATAAQLTEGVVSVVATANAFAALKAGGSVVPWGHRFYGGDSSTVAARIAVGVARVYSGRSAFAAVKTDGSVVAWGAGYEGGDATGVTGPIASIVSADSAFAARRTDGSVVAWGYAGRGGNASSVASRLTSVASVYSTKMAFAAVRTDGSVVTWGDAGTGGDSGTVAAELRCCVGAVFSTDRAFCALRHDGTVVTWGDVQAGGRQESGGVSVAAALQSARVRTVAATQRAFTATLDTGAVVSWGDTGFGGAAPDLRQVQSVKANSREFAAVRSDGVVTVWGNAQGRSLASYAACDGAITGSPVYLYGNGVTAVAATASAFAFLVPEPSATPAPASLPPAATPAPVATMDTRYGPPVVWGDVAAGGSVQPDVAASLSCGYVYSTRRAFAAVRADGSVVTWGDPAHGGDTTTVAQSLQRNVVSVSSTERAFAAVRSDGAVVSWGDAGYGGDVGAAGSRLASGVRAVYSTQLAFAALTDGGGVVTWGDPYYGGLSTAVSASLVEGVRSVHSTQQAFAAVLARGVATWGAGYAGGDSVTVSQLLQAVTVDAVYSTYSAFAAVTTAGRAITWGYPQRGGDSSTVSAELATGVTAIAATDMAFAALRVPQGGAGGAGVLTWGDAAYGGDSSTVASALRAGISKVYSTRRAFAAVTAAGTVVAWGNESFGGYTGPVAAQLTSVKEIYATDGAFAAVRADGSIVTWGASGYGGRWSDAGSRLHSAGPIYATSRSFAVLTRQADVYAWGARGFGGDASGVATELTGPGHRAVYATESAFAALAPCVAGARLRSVGSGQCTDAAGAVYGEHKAATADRAACWELLLANSPPARGATWWQAAPGVGAGMGGCYVAVDAAAGVRLAETNSTQWLDRYSFDLGAGAARTAAGPVLRSDLRTAMECVAVDDVAAPPPPLPTPQPPPPTPAPTPSPPPPMSWSLLSPAAGCEVNDDGLVPAVHRSDVQSLADCRSLCEDRSTCLAVDYYASGWCNLYDAACRTPLDDRFGAQSWRRVPHASLAAVAWGDGAVGGAAAAAAAQLSSGVVGVVAAPSAFAAVLATGAVVAWGPGPAGGDASAVGTTAATADVLGITSTDRAFAARHADGRVSAWGDPQYGGTNPHEFRFAGGGREAAAMQLFQPVVHVVSTSAAFAAVLRNGSVAVWGDSAKGGTAWAEPWPLAPSLAQVPAVTATRTAFAAVLLTGDVRAWGVADGGGDASTVALSLTRVRRVYAAPSAFCAVRDDGVAVAWGAAGGGGDASTVSGLLTGVQSVSATDSAFAAIRSDGSVVAWGSAAGGGSAPALTGVSRVVGSSSAFCAVAAAGTVTCWGDTATGASPPASVTTPPVLAASAVRHVAANRRAFAALLGDGSVVAWGDVASGGATPAALAPGPTRALAAEAVVPSDSAFAAALSGSGLVAWGSSAAGGDASTVVAQLAGPVLQVASTSRAFAALVPAPGSDTPSPGGGSTILQCSESQWEQSPARSCAASDYVGMPCDSVEVLGGGVVQWACARRSSGDLICARCRPLSVNTSAPLPPAAPAPDIPSLGAPMRVVACEAAAAGPTTATLSCPTSQGGAVGVITVTAAYFGRASCGGGLCLPAAAACSDAASCGASAATTVVQTACDGKTSCTVAADAAQLGLQGVCTALNGTRYLEVTYTCRSVVCATQSASLWGRNTGQHGDQTLAVSCPAGSEIVVDGALYGRATCKDHLCYSPQGINCGSTSCSQPSAASLLQAMCGGRPSCTFPTVPSALGGDPCPNMNKYLEVRYSCQPTPTTVRTGACRDAQGRLFRELKVAPSTRDECVALLRRHSPPARGVTWWPGYGCYVAIDAGTPPLASAVGWDSADSRDTGGVDQPRTGTGSARLWTGGTTDNALATATCLVLDTGPAATPAPGGAPATPAPTPSPQPQTGNGKCGSFALPGGACIDAVNAYYCSGQCCCEVQQGFSCDATSGNCVPQGLPPPTPFPSVVTPNPPGPIPAATPLPGAGVLRTFAPEPGTEVNAAAGSGGGDDDSPVSEVWFILMIVAAALLSCCIAFAAFLWGRRSGRADAGPPKVVQEALLSTPTGRRRDEPDASGFGRQPLDLYEPPANTQPARGIGRGEPSPQSLYTLPEEEASDSHSGHAGAVSFADGPLRMGGGRGRGRGRGIGQPAPAVASPYPQDDDGSGSGGVVDRFYPSPGAGSQPLSPPQGSGGAEPFHV